MLRINMQAEAVAPEHDDDQKTEVSDSILESVLSYKGDQLLKVIGENAQLWSSLQAKHGCMVTFEPIDGDFVCVVRGTSDTVEACIEEIHNLVKNSDAVLIKKSPKGNVQSSYAGICSKDRNCHQSSEHLQRILGEEAEVAAAFAHPKKSQRRMEALNLLRNKGNFHHNIQVLCGEATGFIPADHNDGDVDVSQYLPCTYCLGFYSSEELWQHVKYHCPEKPPVMEESETTQKTSITSQAKILLSSASLPDGVISAELKLINAALLKAHNDEIKANIIDDAALKMVGAVLLRELGEKRKNSVIQRLRQLARLKIQCKVEGISELIKGSSFERVVEGVKELAREKFNDDGGKTFNCPSLALALGNNLKKVGAILAGEAVREDNQQSLAEVNSFLKLMNWEWCDRISTPALDSLKTEKHKKDKLHAITSDLVTFKNYLSDRACDLKGCLDREEFGFETWRELAECMLAWVHLLNKSGGGDVGKILISSYEERVMCMDTTCDEGHTTRLVKIMQERLLKVPSPGKHGQKLITLLLPVMSDALDTLIKSRAQCGISTTNKYVFANTQQGHLNSSQALQQCVTKAGCLLPQLILSSKYDKYSATVYQVLMLTSREKEELSDVLASELNSLSSLYEIQEESLPLARMCRLLLALEDGQISNYVGKSLDEVDITDYIPEGEDGTDPFNSEGDAISPEADEMDRDLLGPSELLMLGLVATPQKSGKQTKKRPRSSGSTSPKKRVCLERPGPSRVRAEDPVTSSFENSLVPLEALGVDLETLEYDLCVEDNGNDPDYRPPRPIVEVIKVVTPSKRGRKQKQKSLTPTDASKSKLCSRKRWTEDENSIFYKRFKKCLEDRKMPSLDQLDEGVRDLAAYSRSKLVIRTKISNIINGKQLFIPPS